MIFRDFFKVRYAEEESRVEGGGGGGGFRSRGEIQEGGRERESLWKTKRSSLTAPDEIV